MNVSLYKLNFMNPYHIIYTTKKGKVRSVHKLFNSIGDAEIWLTKIGATYWEIGI